MRRRCGCGFSVTLQTTQCLRGIGLPARAGFEIRRIREPGPLAATFCLEATDHRQDLAACVADHRLTMADAAISKSSCACLRTAARQNEHGPTFAPDFPRCRSARRADTYGCAS